MHTKTMLIQGSIIALLVVALTLGIQAIINSDTTSTTTIEGETQSVIRGIEDNFTACTLSQGILVGKQPLFIYQNTSTKEQAQLQAVKVAAGIINDQPVCQYYNSQSQNVFSIILPGTFSRETCKVVNSDRIGFLCDTP